MHVQPLIWLGLMAHAVGGTPVIFYASDYAARDGVTADSQMTSSVSCNTGGMINSWQAYYSSSDHNCITNLKIGCIDIHGTNIGTYPENGLAVQTALDSTPGGLPSATPTQYMQFKSCGYKIVDINLDDSGVTLMSGVTQNCVHGFSTAQSCGGVRRSVTLSVRMIQSVLLQQCLAAIKLSCIACMCDPNQYYTGNLACSFNRDADCGQCPAGYVCNGGPLSSAVSCTADYFSDSGNACLHCPGPSTSPAGSMISGCTCPPGWYGQAFSKTYGVTTDCLLCPSPSISLQNSLSLTDCTCPPGMAGQVTSATTTSCEVCPVGSFCTGDLCQCANS